MSTNSLYPGTTNGVCVTSIIKDKIREYMMGDSSHQVKSPVEISICETEKDKIDSVIQENKILKQDPVSTTDLVLPSSLAVSMHNSTEPCPHKQDIVTSVRRIGNSLDALLQESKKAARTRPVKKSTLANQQNADRLFISSDQIRSRKSVSLHDICEEYIQFITVNSSASADEEAISTTSGNETEAGIKNEEIELEIIPVNAASIRNGQISVITINENSPRKPMNSLIIQSVEEMHVAVENECEKSNGENENNVAVEKLTTDMAVVEKEAAVDSEIFTNLNGVKGSLDEVTAAEEPPQNITAIVKEPEQEKENEKENNVDQKKEQHDIKIDIADDKAVNEVVEKIDEKPTSNGLSHNINDEIEDDDIADEDDVVDQPSPSILSADAKDEQSPEPISVPEKPESESETKSEPIVEPKEPVPETEQKDVEPEIATAPENEPPVIEEPIAKSPVVVAELDEKMDTDVEEAVEQNSPVVRESPVDEKMETDEVKTDSSPETVPSPVEDPTPSPAVVEKVQEPVTEVKESPPEEKPSTPVTVAEKSPPSAEVADPVDEMDTTDAESVIKSDDDQSTKPTVEESKPEITAPVVEIKLVEVAEKEKEPEKVKPIEDPVPETKIEKKPVEPEKEPAAKEPANVASVKRKAADTGEEPEQDRDGGISSSSSSGSEADNTQECKRIRFDESIFEEDERERLIREFVERSTETSDEIGKNCDKLQHEIAALSDLARAKELEWNSIMRLLKLKEEMLERILFKKRHIDCQSKPELDSNLNKLYKNFVTSSTTSTDQIKSSSRSETSTPTNINNHVTVVPIGSSMTPGAAAAAVASAAAAAATASVSAATSHISSNATTTQDLYSSSSGNMGGKSSSSMNSTLTADAIGGKFRPQHRPILPKPPSAAQAAAQSSSHLAHTLHAVQQAAAAQQQAASAIQPPHSSSQSQQQQLREHQAQSNMMQSNAAAAAAAAASLLAEQNSIIGEGRQGAILDVKSIIADFRSKNPDSLPRRGRRNLPPFSSRGISDGGPRFLANNLANTSLLSMANIALGSGSHIRTSVSSTTHNDHRPNSFIIGQDNSVPTSMGRTEMQMRHPTIDSLMLSVNHAAAAGNSSQPNSTNSNSNNSNNDYFRETLVKMAKMSEKRGDMSNAAMHMGGNNKGGGGSHLPPPPPYPDQQRPYPEVTLHPVLSVPQSSGSPPVQNSLLHGILTKSNAAAAAAAAQAASNQHHPSSTVGNAGSVTATSVGNIQHRPTTFSPTLARLLTAPERSRGHRGNMGSSGRTTKSTLNEILNSKKTRTEVTITPVTTSTSCVTKNGSDVVLVDDDDESEVADRLVIDEGREVVAESASNVIPADQVPECQGCHKKAAQFVCAGCGNQWYCSRECQVQAWEDHSEMCSG